MQVDLIIESERVFTGADGTARSAAIAVSDDRIVAVGPRDSVRALAREKNGLHAAAQIRNFGNALVIPGFHDAHLHFFHSALYSSPLATTFLGTSEEDCVDQVKRLAQRRPAGWLLAQGWREYRWNPPVLPTKRSLDKAFPDRPVALYSGDAHTLWLNSAALRELGMHRESTPPPGGSYERDEHGELTGIVRESAAMELMPRIMNSFSDAEVREAYRGFLQQLAQHGVTSVCDLSLMPHPGLDFVRDDVHGSLLDSGQLTTRVHLFPTLLEGDFERFEDMRQRYAGPLLQASGLKQFFDGVSSQHTAWLSEPYHNARFERDRGRPTVEPALLRNAILAAAEKGYPVRIHTIGDAAIHAALDIFEEARQKFGPLPNGRRNCLEHVENFLPGDIERLARLQAIASVQPPHMTLDPGGPERDLGPRRTPLMWPFRSLWDAGAMLAFGTDSPVVNPNPMGVLYSAVTRQDPTTHEPTGGWLPGERLGASEVLQAYTKGSAATAGREHELGTLLPGMLADITVLDHDVLTCDAKDILTTKPIATFMGGNVVFER